MILKSGATFISEDPIFDDTPLIVLKYNLVITNKAVLKESCVVKSVALNNESSWVAWVAQGHQHLKMMTMHENFETRYVHNNPPPSRFLSFTPP